jgi:hypothetical protein
MAAPLVRSMDAGDESGWVCETFAGCDSPACRGHPVAQLAATTRRWSTERPNVLRRTEGGSGWMLPARARSIVRFESAVHSRAEHQLRNQAPSRGLSPDKENVLHHPNDDVRFAGVSFDFLFALERDEITFDQWALGAYLVGKVDYRRNEASFTLRSLADACGWSKSQEALRVALCGLRDAEWIGYQSVQGKRSPYVFSLDRLLRRPGGGAGSPTTSNEEWPEPEGQAWK